MSLPNVWSQSQGESHHRRLRSEAKALSLRHQPPVSKQEWVQRAADLKSQLAKKLFLETDGEPGAATPLDFIEHGSIPAKGYRVARVSFLSQGPIRMTGTLYIPDGEGPFPAVLNVHGHHANGKIAERVQSRGHELVQKGFVVLTVDVAGAGERGNKERVWQYHGALLGGSLILSGDTLLGWQVRDNRRAVDLLTSLPYVDAERIGVTGASGGGNQAMWVAAMDDRLKAVVLVVSAGAFEAFVGRRNCICETLPGGLLLSEQWGVLGLIAPRPLLILHSMHDQPAFGVAPLSDTAEKTVGIYHLFEARDRFDHRFYDLPHGYWPPMLEAASGWFRFWLQSKGNALPTALSPANPLPPDDLICFPQGERPQAACGYPENIRFLTNQRKGDPAASPQKQRETLAALVGWKEPDARTVAEQNRCGEIIRGRFTSARGLPIPFIQTPTPTSEVIVILSGAGKNTPFVEETWQKYQATGAGVVTLDLPGTGELLWEEKPVSGSTLHDTSRACLWLGYTLASEWAEVIVSLCRLLQEAQPHCRITLIAEKEAALAALIALALHPELPARVEEHEVPASLADLIGVDEGSLAWLVPGLLPWGDLKQLRKLGNV